MFTGIVQGTARVVDLIVRDDFRQIKVNLPMSLADNLQTGASIAINGVCLTLVHWQHMANGAIAVFDVIEQTLKVTSLGSLNVGDEVNIERAAKFGDEIGGHMVSGHIATTAEVAQLIKTEDNCRVRFRLDKNWLKYIFDKGFIGIDGCSLTVAETTDSGFFVYLIPETLKITRFSELRIGDVVNIEIDSHTQTVVDTVEEVLKRKKNS